MTSAAPDGSKVTLDPSMTRVDNQVPVQTRSERFHSTNPADFAAVTGREAEWRLSPVKELSALIDGPLDGGDYPIEAEPPPGVTVGFVDKANSTRGAVAEPEDKLAANAWSQVTKVLTIEVASEQKTTTRVVRKDLGATPRAAHTLITVNEGCHGVVILESYGDALLGENLEVALHPGSSLELVSLQEWNDDSIHYASHFGAVHRDAALTHIVASMGGHIVTVNPSVTLAGQGSSGELYGVYFADAHQHLEHRVYVHHEGPDTMSRVSYKGALHGTGARTVWIGDVLIGAEATGTDSYEENRNLVLSDGTRADSIPNLEINTGDIAGAGHASATGRFDDEHLFYLQSRGIPEVQARRLVVQGFLGAIVHKMSDEQLRDQLLERVKQKLRETEETA